MDVKKIREEAFDSFISSLEAAILRKEEELRGYKDTMKLIRDNREDFIKTGEA